MKLYVSFIRAWRTKALHDANCEKSHSKNPNETCMRVHHLPPVNSSRQGERFIAKQASIWIQRPFNIENLARMSFDAYEDDEYFYAMVAYPDDPEAKRNSDTIMRENEKLMLKLIQGLQSTEP